MMCMCMVKAPASDLCLTLEKPFDRPDEQLVGAYVADLLVGSRDAGWLQLNASSILTE